MTSHQKDLVEFIFWCSCQVLELAGIGAQSEWASDTSRGLRHEARFYAAVLNWKAVR